LKDEVRVRSLELEVGDSSRSIGWVLGLDGEGSVFRVLLVKGVDLVPATERIVLEVVLEGRRSSSRAGGDSGVGQLELGVVGHEPFLDGGGGVGSSGEGRFEVGKESAVDVSDGLEVLELLEGLGVGGGGLDCGGQVSEERRAGVVAEGGGGDKLVVVGLRDINNTAEFVVVEGELLSVRVAGADLSVLSNDWASDGLVVVRVGRGEGWNSGGGAVSVGNLEVGEDQSIGGLGGGDEFIGAISESGAVVAILDYRGSAAISSRELLSSNEAVILRESRDINGDWGSDTSGDDLSDWVVEPLAGSVLAAGWLGESVESEAQN